jgi:molecular chaperone DnaK
MVKEAQSHSEEDRKRRELVDLRNQADSITYNLEKTLKDNREKVDESTAKEIEGAVAEARKAMEGEDADAIKRAVEGVTTLSHRLAESLYKGAGPQGGPGGAGPGGAGPGGAGGGQPSGKGPGSDDVVDAEYTVKE